MNTWEKELPAEVMVCDSGGIILAMNDEAETLFAEDGGRSLLGTNALDCHPESARARMEEMLEKHASNAYYSTEKGEKRFFFQAPWYDKGRFAGLVEISFQVPDELPHFIRG